MKTLLEMVFKTGSGKKFKITLDSPKEEITPAEIESAMNLIISKNLFAVDGELSEIDSARIITTQTDELIFA